MKKIVGLIGIIMILFGLGIGYYYLNFAVTEGSYKIQDNNILEENENYYLFLEGHKIGITEEQFKKVETDKRYHIRYSWNKLVKGKGEIEILNIES
ncbi:hypothetical protein BN1058_00888 [Paraliobacillus sp. PM-2]|uniref:hypothetical protein n=1 Tax=Paraliobacillus sp. PM-2 TaxID=1462524 RepID=UPI00061C4BD2|nr:hypothetical protein [Paraliobacillus sp. PM-2]CQR46619.1 hypothetical protein BN1058_00888 [Paraliobacillus sp. PM-2]